MKRGIAILVVLTACSVTSLFAQFESGIRDPRKSLVLDGIYEPVYNEVRTPVSYPYVRPSDIIWEKRVWRTIDLSEKPNYHLYYPTTEMVNRRSFVQALMDSIATGSLKAYGVDDDEFSSVMSFEEVLKNFDAAPTTKNTVSMTTGQDTSYTIAGSVNWGDVKELLIKEDWFFDKTYSTLQVRIIGICPVRIFSRSSDGEEDLNNTVKKQTFWIYYPEARPLLANTICYNEKNKSLNISYDDILLKRFFSSYITKMENSQDNRSIYSYTGGGLKALYEAEKLKNDMLNWEMSLWEY